VNLKLRNPFQGSREPWPLATRLARFLLTAIAAAFVNIASRTLESTVRRTTGLPDSQALPERARKIAQVLCYLATGLLFLGIWNFLSQGGHGLVLIALALLTWTLAGWYLGRTVWGLPNAFPEAGGEFREVLRRLFRVIRHGPP